MIGQKFENKLRWEKTPERQAIRYDSERMETALLLQRFIALLLIIIPGFAATYGWKLMRDTMFAAVQPETPDWLWLRFVAGLFLFIAGVAFLAGFIYYRDAKKRRVKRSFFRKKR